MLSWLLNCSAKFIDNEAVGRGTYRVATMHRHSFIAETEADGNISRKAESSHSGKPVNIKVPFGFVIRSRSSEMARRTVALIFATVTSAVPDRTASAEPAASKAGSPFNAKF